MPSDPTTEAIEQMNGLVDWEALSEFVEEEGVGDVVGEEARAGSVRVTLQASEAAALSEIGAGSVILGIRWLLDQHQRAEA